MGLNFTQKLISSHLAEGAKLRYRHPGDARAGNNRLDRGRTEIWIQRAEHNLIQEDFKSPDDHLFLRSACRRFGVWFSPVGNGVRHPVHLAVRNALLSHLRGNYELIY